MGTRCKERGLIWLHCPIPDFDGPGAAFERAWVDAGPRARDILRRGGTVVSHCRGGIGRAGTVASRLLIELGAATPDEALRRVRTARPRRGGDLGAGAARLVLSRGRLITLLVQETRLNTPRPTPRAPSPRSTRTFGKNRRATASTGSARPGPGRCSRPSISARRIRQSRATT